MLLVVAMLCLGVNVSWATDPIETVGTEGSGDAWASRKFSSAYELAPGETYHFTFVNHNYNATVRWYNWLLDCVNSSEKDASGFPTGTYYFTLRSDVYGWGDSYSATDNVSNYNTANDWADYCAMMDGATVDMYVNYSSNDKKIRTYINITGSDSKKYYFNNTSAAIDASSVFLLLSEEMAYLEITTAEKSSTYKNYVYSREATANCNDTWSASDVTTTENTIGAWYNSTGTTTHSDYTGMMIDATNGLRLAARNTTSTATLKFNPVANAYVTIDAVWNVGSASADGNTPHNYFTYGDLTIMQNVRSNNKTTTYRINGKTNTIGSDKFDRESDMIIHIKVNSSTGDITEFYIKDASDNVVAKFADLDATTNHFPAGTKYDEVTLLSWISASSSYAWTALKSISIQQETQAIATANVTFKYEDTAGNSLSAYKADQIYEDIAVGTNITDVIIADYTNTFYNGTSNKYVYADDYTVTGDYTTVQAGGNTITLKFTDYPSTAYTVKAQVSSVDLTTLASGSAYFDGSKTECWSKYVNVDDAWYETTTYGQVITATAYNIPFTATSLDYFFEFEDMTISKVYNSIENDTRASNGNAKTLNNNGAYATTTSTVAAGVYTIGLNGIKWADYDDNYRITYSTDGNNWFTLGDIAYDSSEEGVKTLANAIIPAASYIRVTTTGGSKTPRRYLDYMTLVKTADLPTTVSVTISEVGWATYCSPYILDFSETGATVYTAARNTTTNNIALSEVSSGKVPANTGVILYKENGGDINPAVIASANPISNNELVGIVKDTPVKYNPSAGMYNYIMEWDDTNNKPKFSKAAADGATLRANKAYLSTAYAVSEARALSVSSDAIETTGINNVQGSGVKTQGYFNLNGQRVSQPTKGLYIVNGRKVVVK